MTSFSTGHAHATGCGRAFNWTWRLRTDQCRGGGWLKVQSSYESSFQTPEKYLALDKLNFIQGNPDQHPDLASRCSLKVGKH